MRPIKFRGKRIDNGELVYGYYLQNEKSYIVCECETLCNDGENTDLYATDWYEVDPGTVGQFAGLRDKNGKEIYEGCDLHVLEVSNEKSIEYVSKVEYIESGFLVTMPNDCQVPLACFHDLEHTYPLFEIEVVEVKA